MKGQAMKGITDRITVESLRYPAMSLTERQNHIDKPNRTAYSFAAKLKVSNNL
jgi:hypothetical protein